MRIGVGGCEMLSDLCDWLSILKGSVVSILSANRCRSDMRISVGTDANTHTTDSRNDPPVATNIPDLGFSSDAPNRVLTGVTKR